MKEILRSSFRSHYCGELSSKNVGENVCLSGWMRRRRDHGGLIFIDLADFSGRVQLVFSPENEVSFKVAESVRNEFVITVQGTVRDRPSGTENAELSTGSIEISVSSASILSKSEVPPFMIEDETDAKEELRLRYRYLDIRRPHVQNILRTRASVCRATRSYLDSLGFCEIETPILSKPTPEGARDFLVPSRHQFGSFYALPQSPQLFKQVLMCGGMDKYYQIVRCFRDEDFRANRQPEFTQVDIEMSFVGEEEVQRVVEGLVSHIWQEVRGMTLETPFLHMSYDEVMLKYGLDAPDLRFDLEISDVTEVFRSIQSDRILETLSTGGVVRGILVPDGASLSRKDMDELTSFVSSYGAKGLAWFKNEQGVLKGPLAKFFPENMHSDIIKELCLSESDCYLAISDQLSVVCASLGALRVKLAQRFELIDGDKLSFVWIDSFPLLEFDPVAKRHVAVHHPFTAPQFNSVNKISELKSDPLSVKARAYDLVLNGQEILGGSIRINDTELQAEIFNLLGISREEAQSKFGFLLDALSFGAPPHGGIAMGLDRVVMILCGTDSIREVIPFPKTQRGADIMVGAPAPAGVEQLLELGIKVL
ncbi:MAG TPA: aspartate--tRNA ligase [Oligoflexia bacterium]|mgnify:CR=1 FL=1|nr:aspartate--tRNA ligase [Oligoflexia bacterium]HMP47672.1 aspartate--tRNA ligase [Oligoflexia bacterium]